MKCRDCKYMESVGTNSLYVCTNKMELLEVGE